jgi:5'-3' exonuclease
MKISILDGANLLHRSRYGPGVGDHNIVYNFFRCLRPLIEVLEADKIYMTLEGRPTQQLDLLPEYKSNRAIVDPVKQAAYQDFLRQRAVVLEIFQQHFPIHLAQHPTYEGDDVVGAIAYHMHPDDEVTVVSTDTDFIQMLQHHKNCKLYNPVSKTCRLAPAYHYVTWKALRGDKGDGIPGIPGIGDKKAEFLVTTPGALSKYLDENVEAKAIYDRNFDVIRLTDMFPVLGDIQITKGDGDWSAVRNRFWELQFASMANPISWTKFVKTFKGLQ